MLRQKVPLKLYRFTNNPSSSAACQWQRDIAFIVFINSTGIDIEAGCGQLSTELMKRRKPSAVDNASDARIVALLDNSSTSSGSEEVEGRGVSGLGVCGDEDEEVLDKMFISQDVEMEREVTFADIESRG